MENIKPQKRILILTEEQFRMVVQESIKEKSNQKGN